MDWIYWYGEDWTIEERKLLSMRENSFWMGNSVFDGARVYAGVAPDLARHCSRLGASARAMLFETTLSDSELEGICRTGARNFEDGAELYIRPMYFARSGFIIPESNSAECVIAIHRAPMPDPAGFTACLSHLRRPTKESAPTSAKASCLYPLTQHALVDAKKHGYDTALMLGPYGFVAEFATANIMIVKHEMVYTPRPDGSFLAGITRSRIIELLRQDGISVVECDLNFYEVYEADEIFSTGNWAKVLPLRQLDEKKFPIGPITERAIKLYRDFAESEPL